MPPTHTTRFNAAIEFTIDRPVNDFDEEKFKFEFVQATGLSPSSMRVASIRPRSMVVRSEGEAASLQEVLSKSWSSQQELVNSSQNAQE